MNYENPLQLIQLCS